MSYIRVIINSGMGATLCPLPASIQAAFEDVEFCVRAIKEGVPVYYETDAVMRHHYDYTITGFFRFGTGREPKYVMQVILLNAKHTQIRVQIISVAYPLICSCSDLKPRFTYLPGRRNRLQGSKICCGRSGCKSSRFWCHGVRREGTKLLAQNTFKARLIRNSI